MSGKMNCTFPSLAEDQLFPPSRVGTHNLGSQPEIGSQVAPDPGQWAGRAGTPPTTGERASGCPSADSRPQRDGHAGPGTTAPGAGRWDPAACVPSSRDPARVVRAGPPRVKRGSRRAAGDSAAGSGALSTGHRLRRRAAGRRGAGTRKRGGAGRAGRGRGGCSRRRR